MFTLNNANCRDSLELEYGDPSQSENEEFEEYSNHQNKYESSSELDQEELEVALYSRIYFDSNPLACEEVEEIPVAVKEDNNYNDKYQHTGQPEFSTKPAAKDNSHAFSLKAFERPVVSFKSQAYEEKEQREHKHCKSVKNKNKKVRGGKNSYRKFTIDTKPELSLLPNFLKKIESTEYKHDKNNESVKNKTHPVSSQTDNKSLSGTHLIKTATESSTCSTGKVRFKILDSGLNSVNTKVINEINDKTNCDISHPSRSLPPKPVTSTPGSTDSYKLKLGDDEKPVDVSVIEVSDSAKHDETIEIGNSEDSCDEVIRIQGRSRLPIQNISDSEDSSDNEKFDGADDTLDLDINVNRPNASIVDFDELKDLEDVHNSLGECKWNIVLEDSCVSRSFTLQNRYYSPFNVTYKNSNTKGYLPKLCPKPKKTKACLFCGGDDHVYRRCRENVCFKCEVTDHSTWRCKWSRYGPDVECHRCSCYGHNKAQCPDLWRQYHLTTVVGPIIQGDSMENKKIYCYNCGKKGHFGYECSSKRMGSKEPKTPFISRYEKKQPAYITGSRPEKSKSKLGKKRKHEETVSVPPYKSRKKKKTEGPQKQSISEYAARIKNMKISKRERLGRQLKRTLTVDGDFPRGGRVNIKQEDYDSIEEAASNNEWWKDSGTESKRQGKAKKVQGNKKAAHPNKRYKDKWKKYNSMYAAVTGKRQNHQSRNIIKDPKKKIVGKKTSEKLPSYQDKGRRKGSSWGGISKNIKGNNNSPLGKELDHQIFISDRGFKARRGKLKNS